MPNPHSETLTYSVKGDGVAVVKFDVPDAKENTISEQSGAELRTIFDAIAQNPAIKSVVLISGKQNSFIAGADIGMLQRSQSAAETEKFARDGQLLFERIEKSTKPIVAAIMGTCMGGGLDVALACHYRIAVSDKRTQLALPEVMLGLLPGAGGTQRLPRLISLPNALDMMLTGKTIRPHKAKSIGLVDRLVAPLGPGLKDADSNTRDYLEQVAIQAAQEIAAGTLKIERQLPLMERISNYFLTRRPLIDSVVLRMARDKVMKQTYGNYPAPLKILDVVRAGLVDGVEYGFECEARV